jgi:hypothetical protein
LATFFPKKFPVSLPFIYWCFENDAVFKTTHVVVMYSGLGPKKYISVSGFPTDPNLKAPPYFLIELFAIKNKKSANEMFTYNKKMRPYGLESTIFF